MEANLYGILLPMLATVQSDDTNSPTQAEHVYFQAHPICQGLTKTLS